MDGAHVHSPSVCNVVSNVNLDFVAEGLCLTHSGWKQIQSTEDEQTPPRLVLTFLWCVVWYICFRSTITPSIQKLKGERRERLWNSKQASICLSNPPYTRTERTKWSFSSLHLHPRSSFPSAGSFSNFQSFSTIPENMGSTFVDSGLHINYFLTIATFTHTYTNESNFELQIWNWFFLHKDCFFCTLLTAV